MVFPFYRNHAKVSMDKKIQIRVADIEDKL